MDLPLDDHLSIESSIATNVVRLLALSGCRRSEVVGLTWPEADVDQRQFRLARTKEGHSLRPMGQAAADLLASLPRHATSKAVFAAGADGKPFAGLQRAWERIAKRAGFEDFKRLLIWRHFPASGHSTMSAFGADRPTMRGALRASIR